jgi:hypothetical protein
MYIFLESLNRANQIARWLRKHNGISLSQGLEIAAKMHGYDSWKLLNAHWSKLNPTASKDVNSRRKQFMKVMRENGIAEASTIMELIHPKANAEEFPTITISASEIQAQMKKYMSATPRAEAIVQRLETLYTSGNQPAVIFEALEVLRREGKNQQPRFFELIKLCEMSSPEAALFISALYATGQLSDPDPNHAVGLLEFAKTSHVPEMVLNTQYGLGVALRDVDPKRAAENLKAAFDSDMPSAKFAVANLHETGKNAAFPKDLEKAIGYYVELIEVHKHHGSKMALAKALIVRGEPHSKYDPERLLSEAMSEGVPEAAVYLKFYRQKLHRDRMDSRLPYEIKPDGPNRPKMVRDAIIAAFGLDRILAEGVVASLYGYKTWNIMLGVSKNSSLPSGRPDEDCDDVEREKRRHLQSTVLADYLALEPEEAEVCLSLLQPTGREIRPSLKDLKSALQQRALSRRLGDDFGPIRQMAARLFPGDPEGAMSFVYGAADET